MECYDFGGQCIMRCASHICTLHFRRGGHGPNVPPPQTEPLLLFIVLYIKFPF